MLPLLSLGPDFNLFGHEYMHGSWIFFFFFFLGGGGVENSSGNVFIGCSSLNAKVCLDTAEESKTAEFRIIFWIPIETHTTCEFPLGSGPPIDPLDPRIRIFA